MIKKNFIRAINRLKARNQRFVDKNGVTAWSRESDRIIEALTEYYNDQEKKGDTGLVIKKLILILDLYGVPYQQLLHLPVEFLAFTSNNMKLSGEVPGQPRIQLTIISTNHICHQNIIESMAQAVMDYRETDNQVLRENLMKNWPQLYDYFLDQEQENFIENLQNDYYAGRINP